MKVSNNESPISKSRLVFGAIVFITGFLSPLLIPLVTSSNLSTTMKATFSGLLAFGVPEVFILVSVGIMGKDGYQFLKSKIGAYLKPFAPADKVSTTRFRIGLLFFITPLLLGWASPYLTSYFSEITDISLTYYVIGDVMFLMSLFILGGNFWDKLRKLFSNTP